eukprot:scaffold30645_cov39-Phaeocystis_antarctica.AAC.1
MCARRVAAASHARALYFTKVKYDLWRAVCAPCDVPWSKIGNYNRNRCGAGPAPRGLASVMVDFHLKPYFFRENLFAEHEQTRPVAVPCTLSAVPCLFVCSRRARLVYAFRESAFGFVCLFTKFVIMNIVREHIPQYMHTPSVAAAADQRRRPLLWVGAVPDTAGFVALPPRRAAAAARVRHDFSRRRMPTICCSGGRAAPPFELEKPC